MSTKSARPTEHLDARDPGESPNYSIAEAAHWVGLPYSTTRVWLLGQPGSRAVIEIADRRAKSPSFCNLVELHVLSALRRKHFIPMQRVRKAVRFLRDRMEVPHPLASERMSTDGKDILVDWCGEYLNVSRDGQMEMKAILHAYLERIEHGPDGTAIRLYPFSRRPGESAPRSIVIDPRIQFGRPCIVNSGVPTIEIADRYKAGDSIADLALDFARTPSEIEEAIRYEFSGVAA